MFPWQPSSVSEIVGEQDNDVGLVRRVAVDRPEDGE